MARRLGVPATLADVLLSRFYAIVAPATLAERRANTAQLIALAEELGDQAMVCQAAWQRMRVAYEAGDFAEARRCLEVQERLSAELGEPSLRLLAALSRAGPALAAGQIGEAEQAVFAAYALGQAVDAPNAELYLLAQLLHVRFEQGRFGELDDTFRSLTQDRTTSRTIPAVRAAAALAACELGQGDEARRLFEPLVATAFADIPMDSLWLWGLTTSVHVSAALGDPGAARTAHAVLAPYADQWVTLMSTVGGSVAHYLGVAATVFGDYADAERRFRDAAAAHAGAGAPGWLARTQLEWARMLANRGSPGDTGRARQLAGDALATAEALGMPALAAGAREVIEA
jgi:hypothetical protein